MKQKEMKVVHDNLYWNFLELQTKKIKTKGGKLEKAISKTVGKHNKKIEIKLLKNMSIETGKEGFLDKEMINIYNVLINLQIENEDSFLKTNIMEIHSKYLGRPIPKDNSKRIKIIEEYSDILTKMQGIMITMKFSKKINRYKREEISEFHKLIEVINVSSLGDGNISMEISLGKFGQEIKERKQYSNILPVKILRSKNICKVLVGIYLARYIFMNRKKQKHNKVLRLETLMNNIGTFNADGTNKGKSYTQVLKEDNISNKTYMLKQFMKICIEVLQELKEEGSIKNYQTNFPDKISIREIKKYQIDIEFN